MCDSMVSQEVPQIIIDLVENFKENEHIYKSANYDEENTKVEFINPFFEALGWDVNNKNRASPPKSVNRLKIVIKFSSSQKT